MAQRILRVNDDPILRKKSKEIKTITPRIKTIAKDMEETLKVEQGVGLAGPQVGILKRIIVVDPNVHLEEDEEPKKNVIVAINPEILEQEGEDTSIEACLSFPEQFGKVTRPKKVKVKYQDLDGNIHEEEFEELLARCFCHEIDHLNGIIFLDKVIEGTLNQLTDEEEE